MATYIFFDESGDFNFTPSGSKYFFFGTLTTRAPEAITQLLSQLRYSLLSDGIELERFHATEDRQIVRDRVFEIIASATGFKFDVVIVEKAKTNPSLYEPSRFYPKLSSYLMNYVLSRCNEVPNERIVVITDTIPSERHRHAIQKGFKLYLGANLGTRPFTLLHQSSNSHMSLQVADYLTWAVHRKWTHNDERSYKLVKHLIRSEFDIFEIGKEYFY